jgi:peptide-methionine (R)-S-oxide reductase
MSKLFFALALLLCLLALPGLSGCTPSDAKDKQSQTVEKFKVVKTAAEWKKQLSPQAYHVLREHGTERAFTSPFHASKAKGVYYCAACKQPLFSSADKFDSGTGWPSYTRPLEATLIGKKEDRSLFGSPRTEVHCSRCGGHLGHVFDDGPAPTGLRYCMNGVALGFQAGGTTLSSFYQTMTKP